MTQQAYHAIRAAKNYTTWGFYAAHRYAQNNGVHPSLLRLARTLENQSKI